MNPSLRQPLLRLLGMLGCGWAVLFFTEGCSRAPEEMLLRGATACLFPQHDWKEAEGGAFSLAKLSKLSGVAQPLIVGLDDDPQRFFSSVPPAASDYAVILSNLQKHQREVVLLGPTLAWDDSDPNAIEAVNMVAGKMQRAIFSAPLTRAVTAAEMPTAFSNASVPITHIQGDTKLLPVVNRLAISQTHLGSANSWAGFSAVDGVESTSLPMLARWGERVVFSSALLGMVAQRGVAVAELDITLGKHIRFPGAGPVIAVDEFGMMALPAGQAEPTFFAHELLRPTEQLVAKLKGENGLTALVDFSQSAGEEGRAAQLSVAHGLHALAAAPMLSEPVILRRWPLLVEMLIIACCAALLTFLKRKSWRIALWIGLIAGVFSLSAIGHTWMPATPIIMMGLIAFIMPTAAKNLAVQTAPVADVTVKDGNSIIVFLPSRDVQVAEKPAPEKASEKKSKLAPPAEPKPAPAPRLRKQEEPQPALTVEPPVKKAVPAPPPKKKPAAKGKKGRKK